MNKSRMGLRIETLFRLRYFFKISSGHRILYHVTSDEGVAENRKIKQKFEMFPMIFVPMHSRISYLMPAPTF